MGFAVSHSRRSSQFILGSLLFGDPEAVPAVLLAAVAAYPWETVRQRLTLEPNKYTGAVDCFQKILHEEGTQAARGSRHQLGCFAAHACVRLMGK